MNPTSENSKTANSAQDGGGLTEAFAHEAKVTQANDEDHQKALVQTQEAENDGEAGETVDGLRNTVIYSCPVDHSGTTVHLKGWLADGPTKGRPIVLVHDLCENLAVFRSLGMQLAAEGLNTYAYDMRGHGRSGRRLGHINKFAEIVSDLLQVSAWVKHQQNREAPVIIGQGFGAIVAMAMAEKFPDYCGALVLAAPSLRMKFRVWPGMGLFFRKMADWFPTAKAPASFFPKYSHNLPGEKQTMLEALRQQVVAPAVAPTVCFINEIFHAQFELLNKKWQVNVPTLALIPGADKLVDYQEFEAKWAGTTFNPGAHRSQLVKVDAAHRVFVDLQGQLRSHPCRALIAWMKNLDAGEQAEAK